LTEINLAGCLPDTGEDASVSEVWTSPAEHWGQSCTAGLGFGSVCRPGPDTLQQRVHQPMTHARKA